MSTQIKGVARHGGAFINEFKAFVARGNVIDLAVGIVIGTAFTAIVNSLVADIIMPPIGLLTGGVDFSSLFISLSGGTYNSIAEAKQAGAATLNVVLSLIVSALGLFGVGALLSLFTGRGMLFSGSRQLIIGAIAAVLTFGLGSIIGVSAT